MAPSTSCLTNQGQVLSHPSHGPVGRGQPWPACGLPCEGLSGPGTCHFFCAIAPAEMNVSLKIVSVAGHWGIMYSFPGHPYFFISCSTSRNSQRHPWRAKGLRCSFVEQGSDLCKVHDVFLDAPFWSSLLLLRISTVLCHRLMLLFDLLFY